MFMRLQTIVLAFFILLSNLVFGQQKIKRKTEQRFNKFNQATVIIKEDFNEDGFRLSRTVWDAFGNIKTAKTYSPDDSGRVHLEATLNRDSEIIDLITFSYDDSGRVTKKVIEFPKEGKINIELFQYDFDENNRLSGKVVYSQDSLILRGFVYGYNQDGLMDAETSYLTRRDFQKTLTIKSYKKGRVINESYSTSLVAESPLELKWTCSYKNAKNGNIQSKKLTTHNKEGGTSLFVYDYTYNTNGYILTETKTFEKAILSTVKWTYEYW